MDFFAWKLIGSKARNSSKWTNLNQFTTWTRSKLCFKSLESSKIKKKSRAGPEGQVYAREADWLFRRVPGAPVFRSDVRSRPDVVSDDVTVIFRSSRSPVAFYIRIEFGVTSSIFFPFHRRRDGKSFCIFRWLRWSTPGREEQGENGRAKRSE